jgi:hypothetical protein
MPAADVMMRADPYPHVTCSAVFSPRCLYALQTWAARPRRWIRQLGENYRFWSLSDTSSLLRHLRKYSEELEMWRETAEIHLGRKHLLMPSVDMFKFANGDGIGAHDDSELAAVRLVTVISDTQSWRQGGATALFGTSADNTIVYRPAANHGLCFETKASHIHGITTVNHSVLMMLVLQYPQAAP